MMPRAMIDEPVVEPSIQKREFIPMCSVGLPNSQEKRDAQPVEYKCVECWGCRVHGMGKPAKAKLGFPGQKFFWCYACGRQLKLEDRAADNKKIAVRKCQDAEYKAAVLSAMAREAERLQRATP